MNYHLSNNICVKIIRRILNVFHTHYICFEKGHPCFKFCLPCYNNNKIVYIIIIIILEIKQIKIKNLVGKKCLPNAYLSAYLPTYGKMSFAYLGGSFAYLRKILPTCYFVDNYHFNS